MKARRLLAAVLLPLLGFVAGCRDEGPEAPRNVGHFMDPAFAPHVVSTYPADSTTGPFHLYLPGGSPHPHFMVEFDKLIQDFSPRWFHIEGFAVPVRCVLLGKTTWKASVDRPAGASTDVLQIGVVDSAGSAEPIPEENIAYAIGRTYTVTVDTTLEDFTHRHLERPYRFSFVPEPYFRVVSIQPDGEVEPEADLRVRFNSPVDSTIFAALRITPEVQGTWALAPRGDGTETPYELAFRHEPFVSGTRYTLHVEGAAADVHGNRLHAPAQAVLQVSPFRIQARWPADGQTGVALFEPILLEASAPLDTTTAQGALQIDPPLAGTHDWPEIHILRFVPSAEFAPRTRYTVVVSTALRAQDGSRLQARYAFSFTTDDFRVLYTYPQDEEFGVWRSTTITVRCTATFDSSSARSAFSISPPVPGRIVVNPHFHDLGFVPSARMAGSSIYTVTISTDLRSIGGWPLVAPCVFRFKTGKR